LLYYNRYSAQKGLRSGGNTLLSNGDSYWSSTEYGPADAHGLGFSLGYGYYAGKTNTFYVRGVRAF